MVVRWCGDDSKAVGGRTAVALGLVDRWCGRRGDGGDVVADGGGWTKSGRKVGDGVGTLRREKCVFWGLG
ncbi:hypothetical protein Tco_0591936 [Tanacetum coccineum]